LAVGIDEIDGQVGIGFSFCQGIFNIIVIRLEFLEEKLIILKDDFLFSKAGNSLRCFVEGNNFLIPVNNYNAVGGNDVFFGNII